MARSKNSKKRLSEQDVKNIVAVLETWEGPLTWDLVVQRVAVVVGSRFSRQALDAHEVIKATFQSRKRRNRAMLESVKKGRATSDEIPAELALALQRAEAADVRAKALEEIVDRYREKFIVWLYNARNRGLTEEQLNAPLPFSDQESGALWTKKRGKK
ncbi:MAG: hypothetical protein ABS49_03840 [Erythrobacter sp. SCN 62-14]|nr:MAG: hypothetical protein ABS49_03840 [Erythrobacter sp. SCN 62-14]